MENFLLKDIIRKVALSNKPEEVVRQSLLHFMIEKLGYNKNYIVVEKELKDLPHIERNIALPNRRLDILCYINKKKGEGMLEPLLMVECKAVKLTEKAINQVIGYNYYVKAHFLAVANQKTIKTFWYDKSKKRYLSVNYLPDYNQLLKSITR